MSTDVTTYSYLWLGRHLSHGDYELDALQWRLLNGVRDYHPLASATKLEGEMPRSYPMSLELRIRRVSVVARQLEALEEMDLVFRHADPVGPAGKNTPFYGLTEAGMRLFGPLQ